MKKENYIRRLIEFNKSPKYIKELKILDSLLNINDGEIILLPRQLNNTIFLLSLPYEKNRFKEADR